MAREISNSDDVIDSRDVIERIEELQAEIEEDESEVREAEEEAAQRIDSDHTRCMATCGECGRSWDDNVVTGRTPAPSARCPFEASHEAMRELAILEALQEEAEGYCADWHHGATLIRESYFTEYCEELCKDIGDLPKDIPHYIVIDWEATAQNIRVDYTEVDYDGETYLVR